MRLKWSDSPGIWGWAVSRETIIKQPLFCELWLYSSSKALFSIRVSLFLQWDAKQINQWIMCTVQSIFSWNGLDARFPADMYFNNSWEISDRLGLVLGWEVKEWSSWHVAPSTHPQSCIWGFYALILDVFVSWNYTNAGGLIWDLEIGTFLQKAPQR